MPPSRFSRRVRQYAWMYDAALKLMARKPVACVQCHGPLSFKEPEGDETDLAIVCPKGCTRYAMDVSSVLRRQGR